MNLKTWMVALGAAAALMIGCGGDSYTCNPAGPCARTGGTTEACCTRTQCEYRTGGDTFACAGTDCSAAASQVVTYCGS